MTTILGVTGSKRGPVSVEQAEAAHAILTHLDVNTVHHGDCEGVDAWAHDLAWAYGKNVVIHPPLNPAFRARRGFKPGTTIPQSRCVILPEKRYLDRNWDIADKCARLLTLPAEMEEQLRSGTWATVRHARRLRKVILIVYPDGTVTTEGR